MSDSYLWGRSGPADPEIEKLENLLGQLRLPAAAVVLNRPMWVPQAIAACLLAGVALWQATFAPSPTPTAWQTDGRTLVAGETIRTSSKSSALLSAGQFGQVQLAPSSELAIAESRPGFHHFDLRSGTMHALIWAPPREFMVDTPSARAIDLGCQYTLSLDSRGDGTLDVETGWVAFLFKGKESFVPAGARCLTSRDSGPGTPYFQDASPPFTEAVREFDKGASETSLKAVLNHARANDALTLWHLMTRVQASQRLAVFDRFAQLVEVPAEVTAQRVLQSDPGAIDLCWDALGLESTEWWRGWRRNW
jgi:hypothetical protein